MGLRKNEFENVCGLDTAKINAYSKIRAGERYICEEMAQLFSERLKVNGKLQPADYWFFLRYHPNSIPQQYHMAKIKISETEDHEGMGKNSVLEINKGNPYNIEQLRKKEGDVPDAEDTPAEVNGLDVQNVEIPTNQVALSGQELIDEKVRIQFRKASGGIGTIPVPNVPKGATASARYLAEFVKALEDEGFDIV